MEQLVYTQDRTYSLSLREKMEEEVKEIEPFHPIARSVQFIRNNHATLAELMLHLKSYYRVRVVHRTTQNMLFCIYGGRHLTNVSFLCFRLQVNAWQTRSL